MEVPIAKKCKVEEKDGDGDESVDARSGTNRFHSFNDMGYLKNARGHVELHRAFRKDHIVPEGAKQTKANKEFCERATNSLRYATTAS